METYPSTESNSKTTVLTYIPYYLYTIMSFGLPKIILVQQNTQYPNPTPMETLTPTHTPLFSNSSNKGLTLSLTLPLRLTVSTNWAWNGLLWWNWRRRWHTYLRTKEGMNGSLMNNEQSEFNIPHFLSSTENCIAYNVYGHQQCHRKFTNQRYL